VIGTAEHQDLDELVKDESIGDAVTVTSERMNHLAHGQQHGELVPDGPEDG
jgi:hypothetical protein